MTRTLAETVVTYAAILCILTALSALASLGVAQIVLWLLGVA